MMPQKFNNKTNGITQRRFLLHGNPLLADWVTDKTGDQDWITDLSLMSGLKICGGRSKRPCRSLWTSSIRIKSGWQNISWSTTASRWIPRSIFDVQVKRLHEYKRQLLNILHVMYLYNQIKEHPEMSILSQNLYLRRKGGGRLCAWRSRPSS